MIVEKCSGLRRSSIAGIILCGLGFLPLAGLADITADSTDVGLATTVNQAGIDYQISGGQVYGGNQFYSFSELSVPSFGSADFQAADAGIQNVLGRVTGGGISSIDGTLTSTITGTGTISNANLYLLNPAGILFGDNAQLNLGGSFHATTADYIRFSGDDNNNFYADGRGSTLISADPTAFGFLPGNQGEITYTTPNYNFLNVVNGKTLSLVGGDITIGDDSGPGILFGLNSTPDEAANFEGQIGGRINLVSVDSAGCNPSCEVAFDGTNFDTDSVLQLGNVTIQGGSIIDAQEIYIRSGRLEIKDSFVYPGGVPLFFEVFDQPSGGEVNVDVRNDVTISGSDFIYGSSPGIRTISGSPDEPPTLAAGVDAADITVVADSVEITGTGTIRSERFGPGETEDTGGAADITISADSSVKLTNGGTVVLRNTYAGGGGSISITAPDVELSSETAGVTGISAQASLHPDYFNSEASFDARLTQAEGGTITIIAPDTLTIDQAQITTDSSSFERSADITIEAGDVTMSNGAVIAAQSLYAGASGDVRINATGEIDITDNARISASTASSGDGGAVELTAGDSINLSGQDSAIFSVSVPVPDTALDALAYQILGEYPGPGQFPTFADLLYEAGLPPTATIFDLLDALNQFEVAEVGDLTPGDSGQISIATPELSLSDGASLSTSTLWEGNAGQIEATVTNLTVSSGAEIRSRSGGIRLDNNQPSIGTGMAGEVTIDATGIISVSGADSTISTATFGDGDGGNINLIANQVAVSDGGSITSESGGTLNGEFYVGTGNAGAVRISATGPNKTLTITGTNSKVSTTTGGAGAGGDITLGAGDDQTLIDWNEVNIQNGGSVTSESLGTEPSTLENPNPNGAAGTITIIAENEINLEDGTISTRTLNAAGGGITLDAPNAHWVYLLDSAITTSIEGGYNNSGNILIDPEFVILNNSDILAYAFGGNGGRIDIFADYVIISADSLLDASSKAGGINGTINISNPDQDIAKELAVLPDNYLDVTGLISDRCGTSAGSSSLVSAGPGGLAVDPDGYLPSFAVETGLDDAGNGGNAKLEHGGSSWLAPAAALSCNSPG